MTAPAVVRVGRAVAGACLSLLSAVAFAPAFGRTPVEALTDPRYVWAVTGVAVSVSGVCLLLAIYTGVAPVTRVVAGLAVLAGYVALVVAPGWAVAGAPKRLLTSAFPLETSGAELAAVVTVVGLATMGAVEPAMRRRAAALPLLAPIAALALGCAVSADGGAPAGWLAPVFAFGAAVVLALARYASGPNRAVAAMLGCAMLAAVAGVGGFGSALLAQTGRDAPADVRNLVPQPVRPREGASPLVLYPALRRGQQTLALTVRERERPSLLRYVSLDDFDGEHWNTSARYRRTGVRLPAGEPVKARVRQVEERVTVTNPGPLGWLVSSGRPVQVSVSGLGVNKDTGDVVLPAERTMPADYTVLSTLPDYDRDALASATAATAPRTAGDRPLPKRFTSLAARIVRGESGYPALHRLSEYFQSSDAADQADLPRLGFRVDRTPDAPGGHGLHQINRLLDIGDGTAEQYASAFAVLARALGYDARVVMGFRAQPNGPGVYTVTGKNVHAWVEVRFASLGWVPFDPTPTTSTTDVSRAAPPPGPSPSPGVQSDRPLPRPGSQRQAERTHADPGPGPLGFAGLALAAVGGLLVLYAGVILVAKSARRRGRRRRGGPDRRTISAWRDTVDRLAEAGVVVAPADTSGEIVVTAGTRFGDRVGNPVRHLALLQDEAAFAPSALTESAAEAAWLHADRARQEIRASLPPQHRLRAALSPRWAAGR
jgi:transglutaminase-like putative cysteine protease